MQLHNQLPFGILCILFTHWSRVTAVCPTLPCSENVPVYAVDPEPLYSGVISSTSSAVIVSSSSLGVEAGKERSTPPAAVVPSTTSTSTPALPSTTSSATPTSTPGVTPPATTPTSTSSATPTSTSSLVPPATTLTSTPSIWTPSAEPTVISSSRSSTGVPTVLPSSISAASSSVTFSVVQSITTSSVNSTASKSSASVTVPASITQCGSCRVLADQVQVYYWPTASVKNDCARGASINPFQTGVPYASNASRIQSLAPQVVDSPTTTIVDGYTFTFPSLYVSVVGGISVSDSCGRIGSVHTNPAPVAVQAITTASYDSWPSTCRPQGQNAQAVIDTLALSDIACPTWGLSNPFTTSCDGSTYLTATYGQPYNPVILVPTEILAIDPAWGACTTNTADALLTLPCGIYDPPKALQTAHALVPGGNSGDPSSSAIPEDRVPDALRQADSLAPAITSVNDPPAPTMPTAAPAITGSPSLPEPTTTSSSAGNAADLLKLDPLDPDTRQSEVPGQSKAVQQGGSTPTSNTQTSDSGSQDTSSPDDRAKSDPESSDQKEAPASTSDSQNSDPNVQPAVPNAPTTINLGGGAPSTQGVGALIEGGLGGGSVPAPVPSPFFTPHVVTALDQTLSITNPSVVAIAGSTLSVGGPAHTTDGKYYSLASSGNLIAGTLTSSPGPSAPPVLSVAGSTYTANSASEFVVAGQTLTPGGQIMVASTPVSLQPSANVAVVGGSTQVLTTATPTPNPAVLKFAGSTYTANAASQFLVAGQTLAPGDQITVSSTPISLHSSGDIAVVGGSTQFLTTATPSPNPAVLTFAGSTYTANTASQFVVAGQTLTPGGQITVSSTSLSLAPSANIAIIGTSTQLLTTPTPTSSPAILTFAGSTYTANTASQFVIAGQTLTSGGSITASGTLISLPEGTSNVAVIGSSTQTLASASATVPTAKVPVMTWDGSTYTADASSDFIIASKTLTPGGIITVLGTPIQLAPGAADAVIGSSTQTLSSSAVITPADIITVAGQVITANPTGFAVAGTTLVPGGKGVTVGGTPLSLGPGGTLVVGNRSEVLPTSQGPGAGVGVFEGGQGRLGGVGWRWLACTAFCTAMGAFFLV